MNRADILLNNINIIEADINNACQQSGRNPAEVHPIAVTKYATDEDVLSLLRLHKILHIGESKVQQAYERWTKPEFAAYPVCKHFIGHLQRNKAAKAATLFDFIDSLDDLQTAQALNQQAAALGKTLTVLVQLKLTDRATQSGLSLQEASSFVLSLKPFTHLKVRGYMAIAPQTQDIKQLRSLFKAVKAQFDIDFASTLPERYLSLGMSADFEVAVEEGSSLPRIGSGIFVRNLEVL